MSDAPLTPERLAEIEARANAAMPGPWLWQVGDSPYARQELIANAALCREDGEEFVEGTIVMLAECDEVLDEQDAGDYRPSPADAAFIAHAREDIPALVAEVRRLRALLANLRDNPPLSSDAVSSLADEALGS